ncbi:hypothetical protein IMZ31_19485 (plasmid) [Pontibacillus sp. ALD_SL1]|uniref:hypothetical protein n=1 Tax=Pontibacillus sp. ALD_SL1 TaxID=2777185 RepID=UPI001A960CC5|nr:hypothetical protein [Pontibacillus sp. ALD_SL1]QST02734.1 hypothetical protein IMZ31_19485 [Pontibacillus sp. ALD_SL1]
MELWGFVQENTLVSVILAVIFIIFVVGILKSMLKLAFIAVIIGSVLVLVFDFSPSDVRQMGEQGVTQAKAWVEEHIMPVAEEELKGADVQHDGEQYTIKTKSLKLVWNKGEDVAEVTYKGETHTIDVSGMKTMLQETVEQAK